MKSGASFGCTNEGDGQPANLAAKASSVSTH